MEHIFQKMQIDGYFLEYDPERAGDSAPLRFVPDVGEQFSGRQGRMSYPVLFNAFKRLASGGSALEKADLFAATASRFY